MLSLAQNPPQNEFPFAFIRGASKTNTHFFPILLFVDNIYKQNEQLSNRRSYRVSSFRDRVRWQAHFQCSLYIVVTTSTSIDLHILCRVLDVVSQVAGPLSCPKAFNGMRQKTTDVPIFFFVIFVYLYTSTSITHIMGQAPLAGRWKAHLNPYARVWW